MIEQKWRNQELERKDVEKWVRKNIDRNLCQNLEEEVEDITRCLYAIYQAMTQNYVPGGFVSAVIENNFYIATLRADSTNRKHLTLYAHFLAKISDQRINLSSKQTIHEILAGE